jgi:hypothetical protein
MGTGARLLVQAPAFKPLPYGLMSVAQEMPMSDPHWQGGSFYQPDVCDPSDITLISCPNPGLNYAKPPTTIGTPSRGADPFSVYSYIDCAAPGGFYERDEQLTRNALANGSARAIERAFWNGTADAPTGVAIYPHLASNVQVIDPNQQGNIVLQTAAIVVSGTAASGAAVDVVEAIGLLEGAMATCYGGIPTIHMPRRALAHLSSRFLLNVQGGFINTPSGSLISAGGGNQFTGPDGTRAPDGMAWFYATGAVMYRKGPVMVTSTAGQALRRDVNSMRLVAEQTYQFGWDCCHFAVLVSLGGIITGTPGSAT